MALAACSRCHGLDGAGRTSGAFPGSTSKPPTIWRHSWRPMRRDTRQSGIMQPVAAELDATRRCAGLRIILRPQRPAAVPIPAGEPAQRLSWAARWQRRDCRTWACRLPLCHAENPALRNPLYPALVGQYASFTAQQLVLFKSGKRRGTPAAEIMSVIAQRLTQEQIDAVSAISQGRPARPAGMPPDGRTAFRFVSRRNRCGDHRALELDHVRRRHRRSFLASRRSCSWRYLGGETFAAALGQRRVHFLGRPYLSAVTLTALLVYGLMLTGDRVMAASGTALRIRSHPANNGGGGCVIPPRRSGGSCDRE